MVNVIIPAAGVGMRLRPLTHTLPKALLEVAGQPILGHILDRVRKLPDLGPIWIVVGFKGDLVQSYVRSRFSLDIRFVQQSDLRGLGDALHLALAEIPTDDPIMVILGDTILDVDLADFMAGNDDALGVKVVDDPRRFGVVELHEGENYIKSLVEKPDKPPSNLAVVGLYGIHDTALFRGALAEVVAANKTMAGEIQVTAALQLMVERGSRMRAHPVAGWFDCGEFGTMLESNRHLLGQMPAPADMAGCVVAPPAYIAPTATVARSVIGPYASIGAGAQVTDAIIRNSIISEQAQVANCCLKDSIVGIRAAVQDKARRVNIGESTGNG